MERGVSKLLADERKSNLTEIHYDLHFTVPKERQASILAIEKANFNLQKVEEDLFLDFSPETDYIKQIKVNGNSIEIQHENEHLVLPSQYLQKGNNLVEIDFIAGELSLNRNDDYLYTLLVPDRARTLFPCFDQPNLKASYALQLTVPSEWKALASMPITKQEQKNDAYTFTFGKSPKMSTYLFSFVAGVFKKVENEGQDFPMTMLFREIDTNKIAYSKNVIFKLHKDAIDYLEDYTQTPFPFPKLDFACIPGFQYGGMEHIGAIQYREDALMLDESATENRLLGRAKLIAHETAHMWFGDLVTMDWFNDVWMKEVFANFMADKIVNPAFPQINHDLAFMAAHYPRAYGEDRTLGTNPIRQSLDNLNNAGSVYGSIIYNKAPIMMRQLETLMGKQAFKKGIQQYLKNYAYDNAVWNDLVELLDKETDEDLKSWSEIWVNRPSRPIFKDLLTYDIDGNIATFQLTQNAEDGSDGIWPQSFDITFVYGDTLKTITAEIRSKHTEMTAAKGFKKPVSIRYNSNGMGYGVFPIDPEQLSEIPDIKDDLGRGYAYINTYENTLNGALPATAVLELYQKSLSTEKNELLLNLTSGYLNSIFWNYLTTEQRNHYQPILEKQLLFELRSVHPSDIKKILFERFTAIAYSASGTNLLYDIWKRKEVIPNLKLNQDDFTDMALDLAMYRHVNCTEILEEAKKQLTNPDKLERFNFLLPSLSQDRAVKDAFFESIKEEKNRAKEGWTLTAMGYLNHPLRQEEALKYLRPSLELLEEVQKTGDIFFPKGWLSSTVGKHSSPEAYEILQTFINDRPDLNPALLKKLLQASDDLRRVQFLRKKVRDDQISTVLEP